MLLQEHSGRVRVAWGYSRAVSGYAEHERERRWASRTLTSAPCGRPSPSWHSWQPVGASPSKEKARARRDERQSDDEWRHPGGREQDGRPVRAALLRRYVDLLILRAANQSASRRADQ